MTSQGSAHGRFTRAIQWRNLFQAELALREVGAPSLLVALDYLELLASAASRPVRSHSDPVAWPSRAEARLLTFAESQLALAALGSMRQGDALAADVLRRLLRRVGGSRRA